MVLDLSQLLGWSVEGERAVLSTAARLKKAERSLAVCGVGHLDTADVWTTCREDTGVYGDVETALRAVARPPG
ncbi:hypothetical protein ACWGI1_17320 [Streptomyces sp. NPDC054835]|uniref:hypothetical protein n=1 Tax=Streptomyces sp. NPDC092046 TaxID=3366009 RepID=UPI00380799B7